MKKGIFLAAGLCFFAGCTMVGFHSKKERAALDFGDEMPLRVCVLRDSGVSDKKIAKNIGFWQKELSLYKIRLEHVKTEEWQRNGFTGSEIISGLYKIPLAKECDRLVAFVSADWRDAGYEVLAVSLALFLIPVPEVLGAVESHTHTKGFVMADNFMPGIFFSGGSKRVLRHEGYHMLGCGHSVSLKGCYRQIGKLKKAWRRNLDAGNDFVPGFQEGYGFIHKKEEINRLFVRLADNP